MAIGPPPPIKSGSELDWRMVERAARQILHHAESAQFIAPEDMDSHLARMLGVCHAMNAITDALKLKEPSR